MQTDRLYSNWGVTLWSSASNPCCSWPQLCRNVLPIATEWLGFLKHLRIVFCVTLSILITLSHYLYLRKSGILPILWHLYHRCDCLPLGNRSLKQMFHILGLINILLVVLPLLYVILGSFTLCQPTVVHQNWKLKKKVAFNVKNLSRTKNVITIK